MPQSKILAPLQFRDFRLLWIGLMISNLGTWMQFTAMGFFVARMAGSPHQAALDLGLLGAARAIPVLLVSPLAGVVTGPLPLSWRWHPDGCGRPCHGTFWVGYLVGR